MANSIAIPILDFFLGNRNHGKSISPHSPMSFFILGTGRNGSTLLAHLLNQHDSVYLPPEQYALPFSILKWHLYRSLNWSSITTLTINDFKSKNANWAFNDQDVLKLKSKLLELSIEHQSLANAYISIANHFGKKSKDKLNLIGDHTPLMTDHLGILINEFPDSKYIYLVRHPLDVCLSFAKLKGSNHMNPIEAALNWCDNVNKYFRFEKSKIIKYILIKYEDLVTHPVETLTYVSNFLGITFEFSMLNRTTNKNHDPMRIKSYDHLDNIYSPISNSSVGCGAKELDRSTILKIKSIVQEASELLGYDI